MSRSKLHSRLWRARTLLQEWRRAVRESERIHEPGEREGTLTEEAAAEVARFDDAIGALTEAIRLEKGRAS
jgi:hypothetical protein